MSEQFLDQVLEAVAVGVGAHQPRGGARAIERRRHDPEIGLHDADVEAGEMVELQPRRIGQQRLQVRRGIIAARAEADEMLVALAVGKLDEAQPVAAGFRPIASVSTAIGPSANVTSPAGLLRENGPPFIVPLNGRPYARRCI